MPLQFESRDASGHVLDTAGETYDEPRWMLPEVTFEQLPMLASIDRYGVTVFNAWQCLHLLDELHVLEARSLSPEQLKLLASLRRLCNSVRSAPHRLLWVHGD